MPGDCHSCCGYTTCLAQCLGRHAAPFFGLFTSGSSLQETGQCCLSGVSVQGVGSLLEFNAVEEALI